jgi:hypothetical protein
VDAIGYGSDVVFITVFSRFMFVFVFVFMGVSVNGVVVSSVSIMNCYSFKALGFFDVGSIVDVYVTYCVKGDTFIFCVKRVEFFVECI